MKITAFVAVVSFVLLCTVMAHADTLSAVIAPAGTTSVVAGPNGSMVFVGPLINALEPYIVSAVGALIVALSAWAVALLRQKTGIAISQDNLFRIQDAAKTQAGIWIAKADAGVMDASVDVKSPGIASAAQTVLDRLPPEATALGVTPDKMADMIVGEIGKLQAVATTVHATSLLTGL
jgi:hypothetical protein